MLYNRAPVHVVPTAIACFVGTEAALIFQQIHYWISKCGKQILNSNDYWIYNSLPAWKKQFPYMSEYKIRKCIKLLEQQGLIKSTKVNAKKWNHTKWYTVDYKKHQLLIENRPNSQNNKFINSGCKNTNFSIFPSQNNRSSDPSVENQQIILTKNNYTNKSSYKKEEENFKINKKPKSLIECSKIEQLIPSKEQKDIVTQMVQEWNYCFECSLSPVKAFVNKYVVAQLNEILKTKFANNLENWKLYARTVNSSKFLMGEKETKSNFKAHFLWLIKEETIDSIQNGAYGVGDRTLDSDKINENLKVCQKEVQQMVQDKFVVQIQDKISNETEEQEFKEYLFNREYERDGDKYLIKEHMETIGSQYMYGGYITPSHVFYSGNEKYKQRLFQSYLMKKYYDIDETSISYSFNQVIKGVEGKSMLLKLKNIREKLRLGLFQENSSSDGMIEMMPNKLGIISNPCVLN